MSLILKFDQSLGDEQRAAELERVAELQKELQKHQLSAEVEYGRLPEGARGFPPILGIDLSWLSASSLSKFVTAMGDFFNRHPEVTLSVERDGASTKTSFSSKNLSEEKTLEMLQKLLDE